MDQQQKINDVNNIFQNDFIDAQAFFMYTYQQPPCSTWVGSINAEKASKYLQEKYAGLITGIYQYAEYSHKKKKAEFNKTILLMREACIVVLSGNYCEVFHTHKDYNTAHDLIKEVSRFKRREKKVDFEINLVMMEHNELILKPLEIKKTQLDLDLFYENDFAPVHKTILERLNKKNDKGIVLLHGLPGTGKTTYIRHLIGKLKKKVLLLSPAVAKEIMSADFMDLLIDNPNSILVIEDAENIINDRRLKSDSSISNLLNISDGLLSDFLNVQIICTFNHPLSLVDAALMRKGRLIAKYEFGKLSAAKAQALSNFLGNDKVIKEPMTIAEIAHPNEVSHSPNRVEVVGFRRASMEN